MKVLLNEQTELFELLCCRYALRFLARLWKGCYVYPVIL